MGTHKETVFIVDDDAPVREALTLLMHSVGLTTRTFANGQDFLDICREDIQGCALLDIRMPDISGLTIQERLQQQGIDIPIIFLTGHGDVPMAVKAIKNGALDFFQKPVKNDQMLLDRIREALQLHRESRTEKLKRKRFMEKLSGLTPREREISGLIAQGRANKVIAIDLGISERTVELHRSRVMHKLGLRSAAELARLLEKYS